MTEATYTEADIEDARYEMWIASGGPASETERHAKLASDGLDALIAAGWDILQQRMVPEFDIKVMEAVIRKGDRLELVSWSTFNKGWMRKTGAGGWIIFPQREHAA
ncbi:hypothetical protein [Oceaniradius stylonematis]|uniref:hypothetical protein n=1 Tax=Oceaniradius stylonematis TaxID=2184161 RepID=UPI003B5A40A8